MALKCGGAVLSVGNVFTVPIAIDALVCISQSVAIGWDFWDPIQVGGCSNTCRDPRICCVNVNKNKSISMTPCILPF